MRAVAIDRFGPPSVLKVRDVLVPPVARNEVRIEVDTAGVGIWDAKMRTGAWAEDAEFPLVLGIDGAGVVTAVGSGVRRFRRGARVYAYSYGNPKGGFYAEYVVVNARNAARVPRGLSLVEAGAIPVTGLTALQGVDDALGIARGESVIVHGATGGVGTLALQFAKWRGARVLATASGGAGVALLRRLGADATADGKRDDLLAAARRFAPEGVDAVLAFVGGKSLTRCLDALKRGGRVAYPNGVEPEPRKRRGIRIVSYDGEPGVREFERLNRALRSAKPRIVIGARFPLEQAADAHRAVEGHVLGKVVLKIR